MIGDLEAARGRFSELIACAANSLAIFGAGSVKVSLLFVWLVVRETVSGVSEFLLRLQGRQIPLLGF
jgi:hypothetical protein